MIGAKAAYDEAHRLARVNRREGRWLENPVRVEDGYPGLFVRADGQVACFAGFVAAPDLFQVGRGA